MRWNRNFLPMRWIRNIQKYRKIVSIRCVFLEFCLCSGMDVDLNFTDDINVSEIIFLRIFRKRFHNITMSPQKSQWWDILSKWAKSIVQPFDIDSQKMINFSYLRAYQDRTPYTSLNLGPPFTLYRIRKFSLRTYWDQCYLFISCLVIQGWILAFISEWKGDCSLHKVLLRIYIPAYEHICLHPGHMHMCLYPVDIHQSVTKSIKVKITVLPLISLQITFAQATFFIKLRFLSLWCVWNAEFWG